MFIIAVYVDDILLAGKSIKEMEEVKKEFSEKFKVKDMGKLSYFLGVEIIRNEETGSMWMGQPLYTDTVLWKSGMDQAKSIKTPCECE